MSNDIAWKACYKLDDGKDVSYGALFAVHSRAIQYISTSLALSDDERKMLHAGFVLKFDLPRKHNTWEVNVIECHLESVFLD